MVVIRVWCGIGRVPPISGRGSTHSGGIATCPLIPGAAKYSACEASPPPCPVTTELFAATARPPRRSLRGTLHEAAAADLPPAGDGAARSRRCPLRHGRGPVLGHRLRRGAPRHFC